jgi:integrase
MRASEVRGLPWDAVDLMAARIEVRQKADENNVIGEPKSRSSYRTIDIPPQFVSIPREWKMEAEGKLAFGTSKDRPESGSNIFNRAWKPVLKAARVPHLQFPYAPTFPRRHADRRRGQPKRGPGGDRALLNPGHL